MKCECGHAKGLALAQQPACVVRDVRVQDVQASYRSPGAKAHTMNLKLLDGLVGQYALAHPNREISRVTLIEFALWYQEKINGGSSDVPPRA